MQTAARILLWLGDVALALWDATKTAFLWIGGVFDVVLDPVLSPILRWINPVCVWIGDACFAIVAPLPEWVGLTLLSVLLGAAMLFAFRFLSNQQAIARAKDDIKANLLAMRLFRDSLRVVFLSQLRLLWAIARLQRYILGPVLWSIFPMILVLAQLGLRYQWRPLHVEERAIVRLRASPNAPELTGVRLAADDGIEVEVGPVPGDGEWVWRVRAAANGRHMLRFLHAGADSGAIAKEIVVADRPARVSALRPGPYWLDRLLHPAEPPFARDSTVQGIEIKYPSVRSYVVGADYWVLYFFVVSMATALLLAPIFKVRF